MTESLRSARDTTLCLIGPMGAGKTTVGGLLARRLGRSHVDLDRLLEERLGMPITSFFASGMEREFRRWESRLLRTALEASPCVLTPGAGVVLRARNRLLLTRKTTVVYCAVTEEEQRKRLAGDAVRPLLSSGLDALALINAARVPHYEALAHLVVDTTGRTPEEVMVRVLEDLAERGWKVPCTQTG